ncbi:MAG: BlaI/MecI/CopY family transcriptional regulator [Ruminococcaceae bacterium]|nr:BlaI/MecI/CopY family transcriptional regulator [Oscillospiraceae bacterium]
MEEKKFIKLPESELEVMQGIWALTAEGEKDVSAGLVMKRFPNLSRLKLTTVLTLVTRLQFKGFISSEKHGRANCYTPLVDEAEYKRFIAEDFVERAFSGNRVRLISMIMDREEFTKEELTSLRELMNKAEK